jgi:DNA-binding NtrC family response regulator
MSFGDFELDITPEQIVQARIVVVDDEEIITKTLTNLLFVELDVEPVSFNDPVAASRWIEQNDLDLVVSDLLMPGMDGIKLLAAARDAHPHAPRILLTGYADKENAIKAINEVQLYQYVEKPWDNDQLVTTIKNGLEKKFLVKHLIESIVALSSTKRDLSRLRTELARAFA